MKCAQKRTNVSYGNPIIAEIETAKTFRKHREQLAGIRAGIDNRPPKPQPHLQLFGRDYLAKKRATTEAAFQDLKMIQSIAKTMTRPYKLPSTKGPISLNANFRKRELFRITMDNHRLLERLENLDPVLRASKYDEDHKKNQLYMVNSSYSARKSGNYEAILNASNPGRAQRQTLRQTASSPSLPAITNAIKESKAEKEEEYADEFEDDNE